MTMVAPAPLTRPEPAPGTATIASERAPAATARPAILLVAPTPTLTFVAQDVAILSRNFHVDVVARTQHAERRALLRTILRHLRARRYALVYVWFAEPYDTPFIVLLARLFGVPSVVVVGGYEVTALPALRYGALIRRRDQWKVRLALRGATAILPTSNLLANEVRGLGRRTNLRVIYPGVDCARFSPMGTKERVVLTVARVSRETIELKGLDVFAACSRLVSDAAFVVVGPCDGAASSELRAAGGANLYLAGGVPHDQLAGWYRRAAVYAQLSARESFGVALAEAMACGCAPVATSAGALPEVVGDTGWLVPHGDAQAAAGAIEAALVSDVGARARDRVCGLYSLERRLRDLDDTIAAVLAGRVIGAAPP